MDNDEELANAAVNDEMDEEPNRDQAKQEDEENTYNKLYNKEERI